jgi:hypothetical protein
MRAVWNGSGPSNDAALDLVAIARRSL